MKAREPGPPPKPGQLVRRLLRVPARLYQWDAGWLLGQRFLLLTHVGRRTGQRHQTVLEVIGRRPEVGEFLVLAGWGRSADWYRNIEAHPTIEVAVGRRRFSPAHRKLSEPEAAAVLPDYERRNRLMAPVVRLMLSWLVRWRSDASNDARYQLVRELPVMGFDPSRTDTSRPEMRLESRKGQERDRISGYRTG
jgi:deazaflavin-dependent oxidoreductase (nitroreductase family)